MKYLADTISEAMTSGREPGGMMPIGAVRKDLRLMMDAARRAGFAIPVTSAALGSYEDAVAEGWEARPFWAFPLSPEQGRRWGRRRSEPIDVGLHRQCPKGLVQWG